MANLTVRGEVLSQTPTIEKNGWYNSDLVIRELDNERSPKLVLKTSSQQDMGRFNIGATGLFHINLEAFEWKDKEYNQVKCWRVELEQGSAPTQAPPQPDRKSTRLNSSH